MAYSQSQSLNQLNLKTCMHNPSFDLYLHLSQLILICNTYILINIGVQKIKHKNLFFWNNKENQNKKTNILPIPPHLKHDLVLNVEIKEKKYRKITKIK